MTESLNPRKLKLNELKKRQRNACVMSAQRANRCRENKYNLGFKGLWYHYITADAKCQDKKQKLMRIEIMEKHSQWIVRKWHKSSHGKIYVWFDKKLYHRGNLLLQTWAPENCDVFFIVLFFYEKHNKRNFNGYLQQLIYHLSWILSRDYKQSRPISLPKGVQSHYLFFLKKALIVSGGDDSTGFVLYLFPCSLLASTRAHF